MKHQIYCLDLKLGMGEMIWKIENDWYFGQETKRKKNFNEISDKMRHNQACIGKCTHFAVSKAWCTQTTHNVWGFQQDASSEHSRGLKEYCGSANSQVQTRRAEKHGHWKKAAERRREQGTDKKDLCALRQNIDAFWRKSRRAER